MPAPIALTPEIAERIVAYTREDRPRDWIAVTCDISPRTIRAWLRKGQDEDEGIYRDFADAMADARAALDAPDRRRRDLADQRERIKRLEDAQVNAAKSESAAERTHSLASLPEPCGDFGGKRLRERGQGPRQRSPQRFTVGHGTAPRVELTELTPELHSEFVAAVERGNFLADAAAICGVKHRRAFRWIREGVANPTGPYGAFATDIQCAEAGIADKILTLLMSVANNEKDARAAVQAVKVILDRRLPNWANKKQPEVQTAFAQLMAVVESTVGPELYAQVLENASQLSSGFHIPIAGDTVAGLLEAAH